MFTKEAIQELALTQAQAIGVANTVIDSRNIATPIALPSDFKLNDIEGYFPNRRRARGTMHTPDSANFSSYIAAHKEDGAMVFVNPEKMNATAILNLGTPSAAGHADNLAVLTPKATAAYTALTRVANGQPLTQQTVAEFLEDWAQHVNCTNNKGDITLAQAIAAVRKITIENMRKLESAEAQLSASRGTFESITATSAEPIPTFIYFQTAPYYKFDIRTFVIRLGVLTGGDKPQINLRIINQDLHNEEMTNELATKVTREVADVPTVIGQYSAKG